MNRGFVRSEEKRVQVKHLKSPINNCVQVFISPLVGSRARAKRMYLLVLLDVRKAISLCLHFCCTNNSIIISFLHIRLDQSMKSSIFCRKRGGVYESIGCTKYQKFMDGSRDALQNTCMVCYKSIVYDTAFLLQQM